jgi:hypothetical protein
MGKGLHMVVLQVVGLLQVELLLLDGTMLMPMFMLMLVGFAILLLVIFMLLLVLLMVLLLPMPMRVGGRLRVFVGRGLQPVVLIRAVLLRV